ncbi:MAG: histidine phosphatase family protein [Anaerolineae bacterium]|nr:histidine phosphatase family protein [Anaerolineae bacterium]
MELYLIRHGQSTNNTLANMRDRVCDPHLTELGHRQAQIVAQHLTNGLTPELTKYGSVEDTQTNQRRGFGLTKLYCSPMRRALQTTRPISKNLGITPEVWIDLHEKGGIYLDHHEQEGVRIGYPGMTRAEILAEFSGFELPDEISEQGWWNKGYEDWPACQGRAIKVAGQLRERANHDGHERVALVSHGGFIDALLKALFDQLPSRHLWYHHYNTAITRVEFREDGHLGLRYLNRIDHLPPELVS